MSHLINRLIFCYKSRTPLWAILTTFLLLSLITPPAEAQVLTNPSFEEGENASLPGWNRMGGESYLVAHDADGVEGTRSLRIEAPEGGASGFIGFLQSVDAQAFHSHGVVLRGSVRTEALDGRAQLMLRVDGGAGAIHFDNMSDRAPSGTTGWTEYEIRLEVPKIATAVTVGVMHSGAGRSWFDGLSLEIDSTVIAEEIKPTSALPDENPTWVDHARSVSHPLASLDSEDFSDLEPLKAAIGDRRVVQLGESAHGVREFNTVKVRLIKFLHQEMGFDVIAFESSLHECHEANRMAAADPASLTADDLMGNCIFTVWHTDETVELFEYILETHTTDRPLLLAGFDTQTSSRLSSTRPDFWRTVLEPFSETYAEEVVELDHRLMRLRASSQGQNTDSLTAAGPEMKQAYQELADYISDREERIAELHPDRPHLGPLARRLAVSTVHLIDQITLQGGARTEARDRGMADNLDFLLDEVYPDRKVITWGHNFHLRHANELVAPSPVKTMGQWVAERRRDELYTVGLYMRWGQAALNNRQVYNVQAPASGSLESILGHVDEPILFMDLTEALKHPGADWLKRPIDTFTWGRSIVTMELPEQYDAVLFIDRVHPPQYR